MTMDHRMYLNLIRVLILGDTKVHAGLALRKKGDARVGVYPGHEARLDSRPPHSVLLSPTPPIWVSEDKVNFILE